MIRFHWLMRLECKRLRPLLDDWLDQRSVTPLPEDLGEHIRDCRACREYVSQWNAFELQVRALRERWPTETELAFSRPSPRARTTAAKHGRPAPSLLAAAVLSLVLAVALVLSMWMIGGRNGASGHGDRPLATQARTTATLAPDLPVAATR